jgi:hypothetical protein
MEYVLFWIVFAILSSILAGQRNRSQLGWFFIGLIFGPFGLLVAFVPKKEKAKEKVIQLDKEQLDLVLKLLRKGKSVGMIAGAVNLEIFRTRKKYPAPCTQIRSIHKAITR